MLIGKPYVVYIKNNEGGTDRVITSLTHHEVSRLIDGHIISNVQCVVHCNSIGEARQKASGNLGAKDYVIGFCNIECLVNHFGPSGC